ncbi:uncharacterized protein B0T23DRAFT_408915 [Neurospora hispaniola]|uniref:Uncharacterized protein n=1 Tax=Neurospora hispaniola TaxID=588809 RepID=A0AAJ0HXS7_9PEZI|nr:hypothetical protein B0T23DRAFT_408915 [Neurospora hispaniola]
MCKLMAFTHRLAYTSLYLHGRHFCLDLTFIRAASHPLQIRNDGVNRQSLMAMILQKQQVDVDREMTNHHRQRDHPRSVLNVSLCNDKFATREESMQRTCTTSSTRRGK